MQLFDNDFVFSNQPRQRLTRHGLFWVMAWLYFSFLYSFLPIGYFLNQGDGFWRALGRSYLISGTEAILFMPAHMLLVYGILYVLFPRFVYPKHSQYVQLVVGIIVLMVITGAFSAAIAKWIVNPLRDFLGVNRANNSFSFAMMAGLRGSTTLAGFGAAIKLAKVWYLKQQAYQQIEHEKVQAELQLLKSQVHPHFLFNTLNNLYALTLRRSEQSPAVVLKLSELLSYMLYECNAAEVSLAKEIAFMKNYIGLEQLRYGDRLDMSVSISGDWKNKQIAPLLLIPFVENAFKHGTSEQLEQAWMHLDLTVTDNTLKFKLINSREVEPHSEQFAGGIGLRNVQKRLELLYPNRHDLRLIAEDETFMVVLTLQLTQPISAVSTSKPQPVYSLT